MFNSFCDQFKTRNETVPQLPSYVPYTRPMLPAALILFSFLYKSKICLILFSVKIYDATEVCLSDFQEQMINSTYSSFHVNKHHLSKTSLTLRPTAKRPSKYLHYIHFMV